ncbi:VWA domain-containing protein, partial [Alloacidobacterium sp.]|uniref:VWA domain-containing protein n=1 Tax=Alloacidobacterium sp. TaxID=2951999 RepID=UPI002D51F86C
MRILLTILLFSVLTVAAQQTGQNTTQPANNNAYTISVNTTLVIETVVVKDRNGDSVDGLTANDFNVTENGVPQSIKFFEHEQLAQPSVTVSSTQLNPEQVKIYDKLSRVKITPETDGNTRYKNHRLLCFYFDMTSMPPPDQLRALKAAQTFIREQMQPADLIAIMRYAGGSVDVLQDFTGDRNRLLSILETIIVGEGQGLGESSSDASTSDIGAAFGQDDSEFNIFNTDRQLSALQTAADILGHLSEKKLLIYFASGLSLNGLNNQAQLHATINAAVRAGVSFWPIDARGLVAQAPLGDATKGSPGGVGMYSGAAALAVTTNLQQSQDTLYTLAADSGGKALLDDNDLTHGIRQAEQSVHNYYIIGYYTSNATKDGRFRRIKITLNNNQSAAALDYRAGYYAPKEFSKFNAVDKERQLEDALMLPDPVTELTIAMEINYFQLNSAEYFVPITVKVPGRELVLAKRGGYERTLIDFVGEIKDSYGTTISNLRDHVNIKLSDATASELAKQPIEYDAGFTLLPSKYTIKILARDDETGRIGTYQASFIVPNLNRETKRVAVSSIVLSSQQIDVHDAIYNAAKEKEQNKAEAVDPLVQNGRKFIPSVTRVFSQTRPMY